MRDQQELSPCCSGNPSVLSHGHSWCFWKVGSLPCLTRILQSLEGIASKSEFLGKWLYICFSTKQQPSAEGVCSFIAAFEYLKWLCLLSLVRVKCGLQDEWRPCLPSACLGRISSICYGRGKCESFYGPVSHKSREMQPPRRVGGPLSQQPGLSALQAVVLYLCQHSLLQLRIYVSE